MYFVIGKVAFRVGKRNAKVIKKIRGDLKVLAGLKSLLRLPRTENSDLERLKPDKSLEI